MTTRSFFYRMLPTLLLLVPCLAVPAAETNEDQPPVIMPALPGKDDVSLHFNRQGGQPFAIRPMSKLSGLQRNDAASSESQATAIAQALVDGPTEEEQSQGFSAFLPTGTSLYQVTTAEPNIIKIFLTIPADFVTSTSYSEAFVEHVCEHFIESLRHLGYTEFAFYVKDPETGSYVSIRNLLPAGPESQVPESIEPQKEPGSKDSADAPNVRSSSQNEFVGGALSGKSVVLNASHGWLDDNSPSRWRVQRTLTFQVLEDYASAEFMSHYVIPMLQNAGARIRPVREPDGQSNMVVVDNAMSAPNYQETGSGWFNSGLDGYIHKSVFTGLSDNPFGNAGATRLVSGVTSVGAPTASASYVASIPANGYYNVYISYAAGSDRTTNAHWQVHHSGGVSDFRINQRHGGGTWILLGNFYFASGDSAEKRKVVALNDNGDSNYLNVDAVRFGGGMGSVARRTHGISGKPRWQEEANNYMQYTGMLASTLMTGDDTTTYDDEQLGWSNRPQYARWEESRDGLGSNLVYLGWHTNASGYNCTSGVENQGGGRGTSSYRDTTGVADEINATAATVNLATKVHNAFILSARTYQSGWNNRGIVGSNGYGESSQGNLGNNVAGFFFEGLFHDNSQDAAAYKDPKFRYAAARGIVHGLIDYYGGTVYPPEPVSNFRVRNIGNNQVRLEWTAGPAGTSSASPLGSAATQYRVYKSQNGYGFDNGTNTGSNALSYTSALSAGETAYFRVVAVNSAGISTPSPTMAVRVPHPNSPTVLLVNGYLRNDQFLGPILSSNIGGCGTAANLYRSMDPREFQSYNYSVKYAKAIAATSTYGIDAFSREAVKQGQVNLNSYPVVFWIGGQEGEADTTDNVDDTSLVAVERTAIANYLENGGRLFISGSEIAWDLGRPAATPDERAFMTNYLKANYSLDSSNTYTAQGTAGVFSGLGSFAFDNGSGDTYQVRFADVIVPTGGATANLAYVGGTGGTAGIQYEGNFGNSTKPGKLIYMGFGLETITSPTTLNSVVGRFIPYLNIPWEAQVTDWKPY